jgi:hypothetical protein
MAMDTMSNATQEIMEEGFYFYLMDIMRKVQERGSEFISGMEADETGRDGCMKNRLKTGSAICARWTLRAI